MYNYFCIGYKKYDIIVRDVWILMGLCMTVMRKNVAVLVDTMDGNYQSLLSSNLIRSAKDRSINLIFISGMASGTKVNLMSEHNAIFQVLSTEKIDGIICVLGSLMSYLGRKGVDQLVALYDDIPNVSISIGVSNAINIYTDNYKTMYKMTEHILVSHNYKRIGYI
jgi:DNA-binding LacI/PurR family transcriptional regulator